MKKNPGKRTELWEYPDVISWDYSVRIPRWNYEQIIQSLVNFQVPDAQQATKNSG